MLRRVITPLDLYVGHEGSSAFEIGWSRASKQQVLATFIGVPIVMGVVVFIAWKAAGPAFLLLAIPCAGVTAAAIIASEVAHKRNMERGPILVVDPSSCTVLAARRRSLVGQRVLSVVYLQCWAWRSPGSVPIRVPYGRISVLIENPSGDPREEILMTILHEGRPAILPRLRRACADAHLPLRLVVRKRNDALSDAELGPSGAWDDADADGHARVVGASTGAGGGVRADV